MMIEYHEGDLTPEEEAEKLSEILDEIKSLRLHLIEAEVEADPDLPDDEQADPDALAGEALEQIGKLEQRLKPFYSVHINYENALEYLQEVREHTTAHDFGEAAIIAKDDLEKRLGQYLHRLLQDS